MVEHKHGYKIVEHSTSVWWNSDVSLDPFVQALHRLVLDRGYRSRLSFARALGKSGDTTVCKWYKGRSVPTPEDFGKILILLAPDEKEHELLVGPYADLIAKGKGIPAEKNYLSIARGVKCEVGVGIKNI